MTEKGELDWASAEVTDATLVVSLSEKPTKKWRDAFQRATALLGHGNWHTRLNREKRAVKVDPVELGQEDRVRQFLEGALLEANRTILAEAELFSVSSVEHGADEPDTSADDEMTARYREFARH